MQTVLAEARAAGRRHAHHVRRRAVESRARHGGRRRRARHEGVLSSTARSRRRRPGTRGSIACSAPTSASSPREERAPTMERLAAELRAAGRRPYRDSARRLHADRRLGFARGVAEIAAAGVRPDVIVHSSSSGGTQAGSSPAARSSAFARSHRHQRRRTGRQPRGQSCASSSRAWRRWLGAKTRDNRRRPRDRSRRLAGRRRLRRTDAGLDGSAGAGGPARRHAARSRVHGQGDGRTDRARRGRAHSTQDQTVLFWHTGGQVGYFA